MVNESYAMQIVCAIDDNGWVNKRWHQSLSNHEQLVCALHMLYTSLRTKGVKQDDMIPREPTTYN